MIIGNGIINRRGERGVKGKKIVLYIKSPARIPTISSN